MNITFSKINKKIYKYKKKKIFLLIGNEIPILYYHQKKILKYAKKKKFLIKNNITIEKSKHWKKIFLEFTQKNLFFKKQIFKISILNIKKKTINLSKKIQKILNYKNNKILLIIQIKKYKNIKIYDEHKKNKYIKIIYCKKPNSLNINNWINIKITNLQLNITKKAKKKILNYYTNNLLEIWKILDLIYLIWKKKKINKKKIKKIISYTPYFTIKYFIKMLFIGNIKISIKILKILKKNINNPIIIIRKIQNKIFKIINTQISIIKKKKNMKFKKKNINMYILKKYNMKKLYKIINFLTKIEINYKSSYNKNIWFPLKILIFMFN